MRKIHGNLPSAEEFRQQIEIAEREFRLNMQMKTLDNDHE